MNNIFLSNIFYAIISAIFSAFFCLLGAFGMMLPWAATLRLDVIHFILNESTSIFLFGFGFFFIGITILLNIFLNSRRRFYHLKGGNGSIILDEMVFHQVLEEYWKRLFPNCQISHQLILKKNKLHIVTDLPYVPEIEQKPLLQGIKSDLEDLLSRVMGYKGEFLFSASFESLKKTK